MRRTSEGVEEGRALLDARMRRAESHDPARVVRALEPLVTPQRRQRLQEVIDRRLASVTLAFDSPYDPHNGAAVLRSCDAFGVQYLHVIERPKTPFSVARSVARGAEKWVDVTCHASPASFLRWAEAGRVALVAAHPDGESSAEDLEGMAAVALVVGNERDGLSEEVSRACARRIRVPMRGFTESLNVSAAAAILLAAATRNRPGDLTAGERLRLYARGLYLSLERAEDIVLAS